jgi:hypothetical protein
MLSHTYYHCSCVVHAPNGHLAPMLSHSLIAAELVGLPPWSKEGVVYTFTVLRRLECCRACRGGHVSAGVQACGCTLFMLSLLHFMYAWHPLCPTSAGA